MSIRYAPSPTGRLHLGNLRTAWISKRLAENLGLPWIVRFEDIDRPRVLPGAQATQLSDLAALGLIPDRVYTQSSRRDRHWELFLRAIAERMVYPCFCSRKEIREAIEASASAPHHEPPTYNGRCRDALPPAQTELPSVAWRFRGADTTGAGDVVIARTRHATPDRESFAPSYPFACAVDDLDGDYSVLVRAWDLASAAVAQQAIQVWICGSREKLPAIFHTSLITQEDGHRLEKRTRGVTLPEITASGISVQTVLDRFENSFELPTENFRRGEIYGESARNQTLRTLGF
jgi:glutamyl-tRNA synthetase